MRLTVHVRGVGGQALPFIVTTLGRRAAEANAHFASREIFGMAQRGGSVFAILDLETPGPTPEPVSSVLLGLELLEGYRGFAALRPGEQAFVATGRLIPPGSWRAGQPVYPTVEEVAVVAAQYGIRLTLVDAPVGAPWKVVQTALDQHAIPLGSA
jgi:hypothetical protein